MRDNGGLKGLKDLSRSRQGEIYTNLWMIILFARGIVTFVYFFLCVVEESIRYFFHGTCLLCLTVYYFLSMYIINPFSVRYYPVDKSENIVAVFLVDHTITNLSHVRLLAMT